MTERPGLNELLDRAEALVPLLRERARDTEANGRISDETISALTDAELFQVVSPRSHGGWSYGVRELGDITRVLARGCASTAWIYSFLVIHHISMLVDLPEDGQKEVLRGEAFGFAANSGGSGPAGTAVRVEGGYRLSGHWSYASGIMNSDWVVLISAEQTPDGPAAVGLVVPVAEVEVQVTWEYAGLAGTGSNDVIVDDVFVPEQRHWQLPAMLNADAEPRVRTPEQIVDAPMRGFSPLRAFDVVLPAVALGAAEGALELFRERVRTRVVAFGLGPQREHPDAWARYADAAAKVRLARLAWQDAVTTLAEVCDRDRTLTLEETAHLRLGSPVIANLARDALTVMCDGAGSSTYHLDNHLQRAQRDVNTVKSHSYLHWDGAATTAGRALLGLEPVDPLVR